MSSWETYLKENESRFVDELIDFFTYPEHFSAFRAC